MSRPGDREADADRLAAAALERADPTGWFEELYDAAGRGEATVPWARHAPHPLLAAWARPRTGRALVVGCGLGDDAEHLASLGYAVTAFDVAPTAIAQARRRFPASSVAYRVADLLALPEDLRRAFDLVVEVFTVQALPVALHAAAGAAIADTVAPGGTLLYVGDTARDRTGSGPPWPLTRAEVAALAGDGLQTERLEAVALDGVARWEATFRRPGRPEA